MDNHVTLSDLLQNSSAFDQKIVVIDAWLIASDSYQVLCTAAPDENDVIVGFSVDLIHENLIEVLLQEFFPWIGSPHFFKDKATIVAKFEAGLAPKITEISQISIHREGETETYDFPKA